MKTRPQHLPLPALLLALALALGTCLAPAPAGALVATGINLPDISLPDLQGQKHSLKKLAQDKVLLLVYWSVTCPHCRRELPRLVQLEKRLRGNPFRLLTVNRDGQAMAPAAQALAQELELPEPVLLDLGPDDSQPLGQRLDIVATPTVLVFDRQGVLVHTQEIEVDFTRLEQAIATAF